MLKSQPNHQLYATLDELLAFQFQVKRHKINHQQKLISAKAGFHQSVKKGRGMVFSEVREYQPGDEIRHIDWKVSARTQKTHTKVFTEELEKPIICITAQTPALFFGSQVRFKCVQALNVSAILAWLSIQNGDRFGGLVFTGQQRFFAAPKAHHKPLMSYFHRAIEIQKSSLKGIKPGEESIGEGWEAQIGFVRTQLKSGNRVFLVGDFLSVSDAFYTQLSSLKKHNQCTLIHVFDPIEKNLPVVSTGDSLSFSDGVNKVSLNVSAKEQQFYEQSYQLAWEALKDNCYKIHVPLVEIDSTQDPLKQLMLQKVVL